MLVRTDICKNKTVLDLCVELLNRHDVEQSIPFAWISGKIDSMSLVKSINKAIDIYRSLNETIPDSILYLDSSWIGCYQKSDEREYLSKNFYFHKTPPVSYCRMVLAGIYYRIMIFDFYHCILLAEFYCQEYMRERSIVEAPPKEYYRKDINWENFLNGKCKFALFNSEVDPRINSYSFMLFAENE
jgi:hypothetical protein